MTEAKKTIVFTGGGSGGHVFPNQPLVEYYKQKYTVYYFGTKTGVEKEMTSTWGIEYRTIVSGKLRRYFDLQNVIDGFKVLMGIFDAYRQLAILRPLFIFSKGGFVSVPVVIAGKMLGIPIYIHEADMTPGLANTIAAPLATHLFTTFEPKYIPKIPFTVSGLPLRSQIYVADGARGRAYLGITSQKPVLLVLGGSLGATAINGYIVRNIDALTEQYIVVHITGIGKQNTGIENEEYIQKEFVGEEMFDVIAAADVVVSRGGAGSVMELLTLEKPTLFIPLPKSQSRGDQIDNVAYIRSRGACLELHEESMNDELFVLTVRELYEKRVEIVTKIREMALPQATQIITQTIEKQLGL
jgi:UDP-N-acetylglucosamine--N-acetylmuramyl-(pentapeptide) pyrophosphoryl-undecaprenol N-acetylglucosamine transferase